MYELREPVLELPLIELLLYPLDDDDVPYERYPDDVPVVTEGLLWLTGLLLVDTLEPADGLVAVLTDFPFNPLIAEDPLDELIACDLDADVTVLRTAVVLLPDGLELTEPDMLLGALLLPLVLLLTLLLVPRPRLAVVVLPANTLSLLSVS